jgi:large subunit ribosomal protein L34e
MVQRVTYRRRLSYNTLSNKVKKIKTPGGKVVVQYVKKAGKAPKCGDCPNRLQGIAAVRPYALRRLKQRQKHVSRAYGGALCATCVRQRFVWLPTSSLIP